MTRRSFLSIPFVAAVAPVVPVPSRTHAPIGLAVLTGPRLTVLGNPDENITFEMFLKYREMAMGRMCGIPDAAAGRLR